jgi:hypothetical protein
VLAQTRSRRFSFAAAEIDLGEDQVCAQFEVPRR